MKTKFVFVLLQLLSLYSISYSQDYYSINSVNEIEIIFEEQNWDEILDQYWRRGENERLKCTVLINGISYTDVGVRYKGFSSYKSTYLKKPLNIKLDYIKNQSYQGIETIKLSNGFRDPTFIREVLAYDIFRKYMPASRANYANVIINGIDKGVFISAETIDKKFLEKHYRENNGAFFKGSPERNRSTFLGKADFKYHGQNSALYYSSYELKSENGWSELIYMIDVLNNDIDRFEKYFNIDQLLWMLAINTVIVNLDSPINVFRNFYLYKDETERFNIIPWDLNMAFGTYKSIHGYKGSVNVDALKTIDPLYNFDSPDFPLISRVLSMPKYRKQYIAHIKTVIEENFENGWYLQRSKDLQKIVETCVYEDKYKFYTDEDFTININQTIGNDILFTIGIADLMEGRVDYLNSHHLFSNQQPSILGISYSPLQIKPNSEILITASVLNADHVTFAYRTSLGVPFLNVSMNKSYVKNNDYEISLTIEGGQLQYFLIAENEKSADFYPNASSYNYNTLPIAGDLVINEILASNIVSTPDENGEYDDYIELFNNSDYSISMDNYFLSDKSNNLTKWKFPDVEIKSKGYLSIWVDEDSDQGSMHANFKLSKEGEDLYLLNSDTVIIDMVSYGFQESDVGFGRIPNGIGKFTQITPSLSKMNQAADEYDESNFELNYRLDQNYPNPFNSNTVIGYKIPEDSRIDLTIYDILGRSVSTLEEQFKPSGSYTVLFESDALSSGIYFYRLEVYPANSGVYPANSSIYTASGGTGYYTKTKKMLLLK